MWYFNRMDSFKCRVCSFAEFELLWNLKSSPYGDLYKDNIEDSVKVKLNPLVLVRCKSCGLLQLRDSTNVNLVYDQYLYTTRTTNPLNDYYELIVNRLVNEYGLKSDALIVDIGSNDGTFLSKFKNLGFKVLGIEPAKPVSESANKSGIKTINEYFNIGLAKKILKEYGTPKLISINYVLANIPELDKFFESLVSLMDSETIISIITGYHIDQFSINMFDYINHDHLTYLTLHDLEYISNKYNLKLLDASRSEHKGGSIHVTLASVSSSFKPKNSIDQLIQRELWEKNDENVKIVNLRNRIDIVADETNIILNKFRDIPIYGIGASISTSYLMNYLEIVEFISELYDDDPNKIGKFSPYYGLKVSSIDNLPKTKDCLALILAWQHTNKILYRLEQVGFDGKILVPLPFPRLLSV